MGYANGGQRDKERLENDPRRVVLLLRPRVSIAVFVLYLVVFFFLFWLEARKASF